MPTPAFYTPPLTGMTPYALVPGLGRVSVRHVPAEEQRALKAEVDAIDLDKGEAAIRAADGLGDFPPLTAEERQAPGMQEQIRQVRWQLLVHAVVRAGVIEPTPPTVDEGLTAAYPPLGTYIRFGGGWTPAAVKRLYDIVTVAPQKAAA